MSFRKDLFIHNEFTIENDDSHTNITCPYCSKGELLFDSKKEKMLSDEKYNNQLKQSPDYDSDFEKYYFLINLICSGYQCKENVIVAGIITEHGIYSDNEGNGFQETTYKPTYFSKSPHIISIESSYPKDIIQLLESSFDLFWVDKMSCANKIRICLESLMDYYKVPKRSKKRDGTFKNLSLHERIKKCDILKKSNFDNESFALAIKWIGNIGSHNSNDCSDEKILLAYELLDFILQDLFINQNKLQQLVKKAKIVNKTKGKKI